MIYLFIRLCKASPQPSPKERELPIADMIQKFLFLIIIILTIACSSPRNGTGETKPDDISSAKNTIVSQTDSPEKKILGKWDWYKTICCGRLHQTTFAGKENGTKTLQFMENNEVIISENTKPVKKETYQITYKEIYEGRPHLKIGEGKIALIEFSADTLVIDYGYMDLQTEYYVRGM